MRRSQVLGIAVALGAGLAAFLGMRGLLNKPATVTKTESVELAQVLVARTAVSLGQIVNEGNFRWQDWPKEAVGASFITKASRPDAISALTGAVARAPLLAGEPITDEKLIKPGGGGVLAAILTPGMRAVSTKISEQTAAGKLILPNDHVDVILIRRTQGGEGHVSEVLFRNVRVLAIGQTIEAREGKKGSEGNVATLELTPAQAEQLALANTVGEITLVLRSIADAAETPSDPGPDATQLAASKSKERDTISVLRYGVKSRAYVY
jgi:Flp pilus assembly protein CpaB